MARTSSWDLICKRIFWKLSCIPHQIYEQMTTQRHKLLIQILKLLLLKPTCKISNLLVFGRECWRITEKTTRFPAGWVCCNKNNWGTVGNLIPLPFLWLIYLRFISIMLIMSAKCRVLEETLAPQFWKVANSNTWGFVSWHMMKYMPIATHA